jgi:hypothetical protein
MIYKGRKAHLKHQLSCFRGFSDSPIKEVITLAFSWEGEEGGRKGRGEEGRAST